MKLSMMINYSGDHADVARVQELEAAGLDIVWVPEAYSFDAVSQMGYLVPRRARSRSARASSTRTRARRPAWPRPRPVSTT
ncbi:MAG: hypothetical protein R2697_10760 [Ilumatobacteraceae bacterium]